MTSHRIGAGGKLLLGDKIQAPTLDGEAPFLHEPALDPGGDSWLLPTSPSEVRWFVAGKEKTIAALDYPVRSTAFLAGVPVIAVEPRGISPSVETRFPGEFPVLLEFVSGKWRPLVSTWISSDEALEHLGTSNYFARRLAVGPGDRIWSAHQVRYIVELFSASGKRLLRLQVGEAKVTYQKRSPAETEQITARFGEGVAKRLGTERTAYTNKAIAAGRDGRLYLLVDRAGGGYAIDRLDPVERKLERVVVDGLEGTGFTMAAGSDGLYVGTIASGEGRWRISWESLEAAKWSVVPEARFAEGLPAGSSDP